MNLTESQVYDLVGGASRDKIEMLEMHSLAHEQVEIPVVENLINGMYTREIVIPQNTILTGRVHKFPYVDLMISGDVTVATPDGDATG